MLSFSIGLPGRLSEWCDDVIVRLADCPAAAAALYRWPSSASMLAYEGPSSTLDEVGSILIGARAAHVVIGVRQPDMALHAALAETRAPFVVALEQPRVAAADMLADTGAEPRLVTRAVACCCALVIHYPGLPGALLLHGDAVRADPRGTVLAIARHLGIETSEDQARRIVDELASNGGSPAPGAAEWRAQIPEGAHKTVGGAFAGYEECFAGRGLGQLVWNRDLFFARDPDRRPSEVLDLTGGARTLIYGPYIHLPAGSWTARVHIGLSQEAQGSSFIIDAYAGRQLAAATLRAHRAGVHAAEIAFTLGESGAQSLEIRVTLTNPNAKGKLAFGHVVLSPASILHPEAATEWENDLRAVTGA